MRRHKATAALVADRDYLAIECSAFFGEIDTLVGVLLREGFWPRDVQSVLIDIQRACRAGDIRPFNDFRERANALAWRHMRAASAPRADLLLSLCCLLSVANIRLLSREPSAYDAEKRPTE